jgi:hypothetical protein
MSLGKRPDEAPLAPLLPVAEDAEQMRLRVSGDIIFFERSNQLNGSPYLIEVVATARTRVEMPLEARAFRWGQRSLDIFSDQLDEFLATQFIWDRHS